MPPTKTPLEIAYYKVADLAPLLNPDNPRWIEDESFSKLQASLSAFDCVEPIVLNQQTNRIVGGHQRIKAAIAAGIESLPVSLIDLSPDYEKALNLLLNKVKGDWDYQKLADALEKLYEQPDAFALSGFTTEEADVIVNQYARDSSALSDFLQESDETESFEEEFGAEEEGDDDDETEDSEEEEDVGDVQAAASVTASRSRNNPATGVVSDVRNLSQQETTETMGATVKVQFGMFSRHIPSLQYGQWIESLKAESTQGESPAALGAVIARRLGITLKTKEDLKQETEAIPVEVEVMEDAKLF